MTNCTPSLLKFSSLNRKKVEASFTGGSITSDGGLLLLREVDKRIGLTRRISKVISDNRHPGYVDHSIFHLLKQRVYAIAAGYEDVNDHDFLCKDICFQTAVGRDEVLASKSTLSRFENAIDRKSLVALSKELVENFIDSYSSVPEELILDFDPTNNKIHGHQAERHYHGYYKEHCFLPMHVFCDDRLLVSYLRPSNIDGAKHTGAILRLLVKRLRQVWPEVKIIFRGDSAFARNRILHWCEHNNVSYITGISGNSTLKKQAKSLEEKAEKQFEINQEKQRLFEEYTYQAKSWKTARKVIAKAEHHQHGTNLRFIITNLTDLTAEEFYDKHYCPRGDMENGIKQLKLDFYSDRNSCSNFLANQFRVLLSSLAYLLLDELRRTYLSKTDLAKAYGGTIRLKLFKIGAVILKNTRRIQVLFSCYYPQQETFSAIAKKLVPT